jgi:Leucine-rich repeat (LRR) protein
MKYIKKYNEKVNYSDVDPFEEEEWEESITSYFNRIYPELNGNYKDVDRLILTEKDIIFDENDMEILSNLNDLYLDGCNVKHIERISACHELNSLNIYNNYDFSLKSIRNLDQLEFLHLDNCRINDLSPIKNLINIKVLNVTNNQITSLEPLLQLTELYALYCNHNHINSLHGLENCVKLNKLFCNFNFLNNSEEIISILKLLPLVEDPTVCDNMLLNNDDMKKIKNYIRDRYS